MNQEDNGCLEVQALPLTRGEQLQVANLQPTAPVEVHLVSP